MGVSHSGCETCAKLCDEAKKNVKKLEKKIQALTIVCTVSVTILGQQGAKALLDAISTFNKVTEVAGGKETSKEENKVTEKEEQKDKLNNDNKIGFGGWKSSRKNNNTVVQEITDPSKAFNELAKLKEEQEKEQEKQEQQKPQIAIDKRLTKEIIKAATATQEIPITDLLISANSTVSDPYSFFLTPSALPFDVYSTTIALGNNYGFGEYYGINSSGYITPTPSANTLSVFVLGSFFNSRKRA